MFFFNFSYFSLFIYFLYCVLLSVVIIILSLNLSIKNDDYEKLSSYECGYNPFENVRIEFDIRFYIISILFLIFDLEIVFIYPFVVSLNNNNIIIYTMYSFLGILTIGFYYEWQKGSLDWD